MPVKKRKSLDDALAKEFVYGDNVKPEPEKPELAPIPEKKEPIEEKKPSIMDKLQAVEPKEATTRFTVDLANSMHRKLSILAAKTGRTKADIVRTLLEDALEGLDE